MRQIALAALAGIMVSAAYLTGCGEKKVVSTQVPQQLVADFKVDLRDVQHRSGQINLPTGKAIEFHGQLSSTIRQRRAFVTLYRRGHANTISGRARLKFTRFPGETLEFYALMEPLTQLGDHDLVIECDGKRIATFPAVLIR